MGLKYIFILCKENMKKIGVGTNISRNAKVISFNFDMQSIVYVRQKIYTYIGKNWLSRFGDM